MLELPQVTLICLTGKNIEGHQKMLDYCSESINFGAVKLIERSSTSIDEWSRKIVYDLGEYVETTHALLVHDDGGIADPNMWNPDWLQYDFCGSAFPLPQDNFSYRDINGVIQRVGNSVGLRSKKLLDLPKKLNLEWKSFYGYYNEDGWVSVGNRHIFEDNGCKFMPFEEALRFGRETPLPEYEGKTFIYHKNAGQNHIYPNFELR